MSGNNEEEGRAKKRTAEIVGVAVVSGAVTGAITYFFNKISAPENQEVWKEALKNAALAAAGSAIVKKIILR